MNGKRSNDIGRRDNNNEELCKIQPIFFDRTSGNEKILQNTKCFCRV